MIWNSRPVRSRLSRSSKHTMKMLLLAVAATTLMYGQVTILPYPLPGEAELKAFLNLTDGQLTSLRDVRTRKQTAERAIYTQISEKQTLINSLLAQGGNDAARIGTLTIEMNQLRKQIPLPAEPYRSQALNILTPEQRTKLPQLINGLQLYAPATQAVSFGFFDMPQVGPSPRILPAGVAMGSEGEGNQ